jgi:hypothetical protein
MSEKGALLVLIIIIIMCLAWPIIQGIAVLSVIYRMIVGF